MAAAPVGVVSDNGPCFRGEAFKTGLDGPHPLPRYVRTRVRSPQTNGVGRSGRCEARRFSARYHPRGRPHPLQPACR
jgi:hypothetical protein